MGKAKRMAVVAREQAEAKQSDIIASERVIHSHRSKLAPIIGLVDTAFTTANHTSIAIASASAFAFAVVASCKLVVAQVSSTAFASTMASTFAAVITVVSTASIATGLLEYLLRYPDPYFSSQSFCLESLFYL